MANGHGGARPGAGRPAVNLHKTIAHRAVHDGAGAVIERRPVNTIDVVEETVRAGGFIHDAAARVGVQVYTLREWRTAGSKLSQTVMDGGVRRDQLSARDARYLELFERMERAEADARLNLLGLTQKLANGGLVVREVTRKTLPDGTVIESSEKTSATLPDFKAISWLLARRWPEDFSQRVEHSGPEGGPIPLDATSAVEKLRDFLTATQHNLSGNGHQPEPEATPT